MFFELRQYRVRTGKMEEWVTYMEDVIIPFQRSKGMVVVGSFVAPQEEDLFIWIRRFEDEADKEALYKAAYQNDEWTEKMLPRVEEMIHRDQINVTIMEPTSRSIIR